MRKYFDAIQRIAGNVVTVNAAGVGYDELAVISSARGDSLAQVIRLEGPQVSLQVFAGAQDVRREGLAWGNMGAALDALKRLDEASDAYQRSADLLGQAGESDLRAHVLKSLAVIQMRLGDQMQAAATLQSSLEAGQKESGKGNILSKLFKRTPKQIG